MICHHWQRYLYYLFTGIFLSLLLAGLPLKMIALSNNSVMAAVNLVPTTDWQNTLLPDLNNITFAQLPAIQESGSFEANPNMVEQLGYNPSRTWTAGQTPDQYMTLGDFNTFKLDKLDLQAIADFAGLDLSQFNLKEFGLINSQTLASLLDAIPSIRKLPISQVGLIEHLLTSQLDSSFNSNQTIDELLQQSPILGEITLNKLPLENYSLVDSIPELDTTPIGSFQDWQGVKIAQVPGLNIVPFSQFPAPPNPIGTDIGTIDIAFATPEHGSDRTISGSDRDGFNVACENDCAHIELSGNAKVNGKQWVSGKYQQVQGGHGLLASVNGGLEPTGRFLFGDDTDESPFKVVVWDISETKGTVSQALFFRFCSRSLFVDLGCTPYFIGPIPWLTYREGDTMFLGAVNTQPSNSQVSLSTGASDNPGTSTFKLGTKNNTLAFLDGEVDCTKQVQGVVLDALSVAIPEFEGDYNSVSGKVCNSTGQCGHALGARQFMSYREDVRSLIAAKPGGQEFLAKLDSGAAVAEQEMSQYFPASEQKNLFNAQAIKLLDAASHQIDPTTGKLYQQGTKERLVQRFAQMYFGGMAIPVDASSTNIYGMTVSNYGNKTSANYQQSVTALGCKN
ncbi:MAG TPA: hypothetical protein V6D15_00365 [Oculatellaceae cyanobacterium]|jgi:hypothetical protein